MPDTTAKVENAAAIVWVSSGAAVATGAFSTDTGSVALTSTNLLRYPTADLVLQFGCTTTIASTSQNVYVYKRAMNEGSAGTEDELAPGVSNKKGFVGSFIYGQTASAAATGLTSVVENVDISSGDCEFYLENTIGQTITAGWIFTVRPRTLSAA